MNHDPTRNNNVQPNGTSSYNRNVSPMNQSNRYETGVIGQHKNNATPSTGNKQSSGSKIPGKNPRKSKKSPKVRKASKSPTDMKSNGHYQSHVSQMYSPTQLRNFNNAGSINSSSVVVNDNQRSIDVALNNRDLVKHKLNQKSKQKSKINKRMEKVAELTKNVNEQYQKDKHLHRAQQTGTSSISRKLSRTTENTKVSSNSKLPYGLRSHLQITNNERARKEKSRSNNQQTVHGTFNHQDINGLKIKQEMLKKKAVPTTIKEMDKYVEKRERRQNSKITSPRKQEELVVRLLKHKDKVHYNKEVLKNTINHEKASKNKLSNSSLKVDPKGSTTNSLSFYDTQLLLEQDRKYRLMRQIDDKNIDELSQHTAPYVSDTSRKLASSRERKGNIYERLHKEAKKRALKLAQELANDLSSQERSSS